MTLKEELELLRGSPVVEKVKPEKVPCCETCDADKLCKHPVVSVCMLTYMHAKYIAQAIESVMMQETNFEFELIISDDCSTDGTREIAEAYQKKYPDKIRVLWWTENLYAIGGNSVRLRTASRGEFISSCEGDDYWIDPHKLQKQVDAMRAFPNVGLCFCGMKRYFEATGQLVDDPGYEDKWPVGVIDGKKMALSDYVIPTPTSMVRVSTLNLIDEKYEIMHWKLNMGDFQTFKLLSLNSDVYCHHERMAVYRIHGASAMQTVAAAIMRDSGLVMFYLSKITDIYPDSYRVEALERIGRYRMSIIANTKGEQREIALDAFDKAASSYPALATEIGWIPRILANHGWGRIYDCYTRNRRRLLGRICRLLATSRHG